MSQSLHTDKASNDKIGELQQTVHHLKLYVETNLTECKQLIKEMATGAHGQVTLRELLGRFAGSKVYWKQQTAVVGHAFLIATLVFNRDKAQPHAIPQKSLR